MRGLTSASEPLGALEHQREQQIQLTAEKLLVSFVVLVSVKIVEYIKIRTCTLSRTVEFICLVLPLFFC